MRMLKDVELAAELGLARATIWRMLSSGKIPKPIRLGRAVRWRADEIADWITAGCPNRDAWTWPSGESAKGGAA